MDFRLALVLVRWPAGQARDAGSADFWNRYFGDTSAPGMAGWWAGQTDGQVTFRVKKMVGWMDIQATAQQLQWTNAAGQPGQLVGRNNVAAMAMQTLLNFPIFIWGGFEECDGVVIVMDIVPPAGWALDGGATTMSVPVPVTLPLPQITQPMMVPRPGIVVAFSDGHSFIAHETGHMLGLDHSFGPREFRSSGVPGEYGDPWCIMSADSFGGRAVHFDPALAGYGRGLANQGPGLNGATRAYRNWATTVDLTLAPGMSWIGSLQSLNSAPENLAKVVRVHAGADTYTVEFRSPADPCDRCLPCPTVVVHQQANSSADRTYPGRGCATILHEIRAGGPGRLEMGGFRVQAGPMSRDGRQIRIQVAESGRPYAPWFPVSPPQLLSGRAPIAAVARREQHLDLFGVGRDGKVHSTWWYVDSGWSPWFGLDFNWTFAAEAPITALARRPDHLDIFVTDKNGAVASAWYHDPSPQEIAAGISPWRPWFNIWPDVVFRQDRPVAAIARGPEHIDLFRIGFDGAVYSAWWQSDPEGWRRWFIVHGETRFPLDSYVTALSRRPDHIDLFAVGPNNNVWSCWWHADGEQWRPWFPLFPQWQFRADQPVNAVARRPEQIDLFVVGYDGAVWTAWWAAASGWHEWYQVRPETRFDPQSIVTAVARRADHMDMYVKSSDGAVWSTYFHEDADGWRPWYTIHPESRFDSRRAVTALARHAEQLDLFELDADGTARTSFWPGFTPDVPPPDVRHALYTIGAAGELTWRHHEDAWNGGGNNSWSAAKVGTEWNVFDRVFGGGGGILYAVEPSGDLYWYKHEGYGTGALSWAPRRKVGNGWHGFQRVFTDRQGHIYAVRPDGVLFWYDHQGWQDGSATWAGPRQIGTGWADFVHVFAGGRGIIYAVRPNGELLWYRHDRPYDGEPAWSGPQVVGSGWTAFRAVIAGPEGTVYGLLPDGNVLWYRHHGLDSGVFLWSGPKWTLSGMNDPILVP